MKNFKYLSLILTAIIAVTFSSCENYSNGERVGFVTQFSKTGAVWKSWEGHLNMTQTGMNTSQAWDFSIDNDNEDTAVITQLNNALQYGYLVKLTYHEVYMKNWFGNRGLTNDFVTNCQIIDTTRVKVKVEN
jgi:hypothetical protein